MDDFKRRKTKKIITMISALVVGIAVLTSFILYINYDKLYTPTSNSVEDMKEVKYKDLFQDGSAYFAFGDNILEINQYGYRLYNQKNAANLFNGRYKLYKTDKQILDNFDSEVNNEANISECYLIKCLYNEHQIGSELEFYNGDNADYCFEFVLCKTKDNKYSILNYNKSIDFDKLIF